MTRLKDAGLYISTKKGLIKMEVIKYYKNIVMTDEFRLLDSELFDTLIRNKIISLNDEVIYGKIPYRTSAKVVTKNFYE